MGWVTKSVIPGRGGDFSLCYHVQTNLLSSGYWGLFPWG